MTVPITRVYGSPAHSGSWTLMHEGGNDWSLFQEGREELGAYNENTVAARYDAFGVDAALDLAKVVQHSVERHGRRATLRWSTPDLAGRFDSDFSLRQFEKRVKARMGK